MGRFSCEVAQSVHSKFGPSTIVASDVSMLYLLYPMKKVAFVQEGIMVPVELFFGG